jgi:serine/threonine protein kinase
MREEDTGGSFSLLYNGSNSSNGRKGFVKVLNYYGALRSPDAPQEVQNLTGRYVFERQLVDRCGERNLSRIVKAYSHGQKSFEPWGLLPVSYIIFELATSDVRRALDLSDSIDLATKLRYAHNAASGAAQLHSLGIAHQDIKPSNLLVIPDERTAAEGSKLADLGRASDRNSSAWHDNFAIPGDRTYAPPELRYGQVPYEFDKRRIASDVYQVGNLIAYLLTAETVNQRLLVHLDAAHRWGNWKDSYSQVLPYVKNAHAAAIQDIAHKIGEPLGDEIANLISCLTEPDPEHRGHPRSIGAGQPYALNRVVTDLDRLSRHAELHLVGSAW